MWVHSAQAVSASLVAAVHVASASWFVVAQQALASLMALAVWGLILMESGLKVQYLLSAVGIYGMPWL